MIFKKFNILNNTIKVPEIHIPQLMKGLEIKNCGDK